MDLFHRQNEREKYSRDIFCSRFFTFSEILLSTWHNVERTRVIELEERTMNLLLEWSVIDSLGLVLKRDLHFDNREFVPFLGREHI